MGRLEGRIAIVTGAASGLGLATSKRFAAEGATVVMVDRREDEVRRAAEGGGQGGFGNMGRGFGCAKPWPCNRSRKTSA